MVLFLVLFIVERSGDVMGSDFVQLIIHHGRFIECPVEMLVVSQRLRTTKYFVCKQVEVDRVEGDRTELGSIGICLWHICVDLQFFEQVCVDAL